jgi:hypothetical protein
MIKEYIITLESNITGEEKDTFICIDLCQISSLRVSGDNDLHCVADLKSGDGYTLHEEYEQVLKDWADARNITPVRLATI